MSYTKFKMTEYFQNSILKRRAEFQNREDEIFEWLTYPDHVEVQTDGRFKFHVRDLKRGKWVRIIVLEDRETIHNIFYDRNFKLED